jgi:hypothetical protein
MSKQSNSSIQVLVSTLITITILVTFIYAHSYNTTQDVSTFLNCLNNKSCALKLALLTNSSNLCLESTNSSSCFTQYALKSKDAIACTYLNKSLKLSCIVSLSIQEKQSYCNYLNSRNRDYTNVSNKEREINSNKDNQELEKYIRRCEKSFEFYLNKSISGNESQK